MCACEGDKSAGRDHIYCNLPPPSLQTDTGTDTGTGTPAQQQHLLMRWASLVAVCKPLLSFDAHLFLQREGTGLVATLQTQGPRLTVMLEQFLSSLPSSPQLPMLTNALGRRDEG